MIWLTRDALPDGALAPWVDVWDSEPTQHFNYHANGSVWTGRQCSLRGYVGPMDVVACYARFGSAPKGCCSAIIIGPSGKELS